MYGLPNKNFNANEAIAKDTVTENIENLIMNIMWKN